jgi:catechol 2,3-dioxygenase-like lactoylglutathione lyase family enzyme
MPRLEVFGVVVSDMARSVAFYRRLGLEFPEGAENEPHVEAPLPGGLR